MFEILFDVGASLADVAICFGIFATCICILTHHLTSNFELVDHSVPLFIWLYISFFSTGCFDYNQVSLF